MSSRSSATPRSGPVDPVARAHRVGRMTTIRDTGGYNQFESFKFKTGKKKPKAAKRANLLDAITVRQRIRFSGINKLSAGEGFFPLSHQYITEAFDHLPIYVMNLTSCRQANAGVAAAPLWRLYMDKPQDRLGFTVWNGETSSGALSTGWQHEDSQSSTELTVGRKSLIDWIRIRLNIWGKKTAPSRIRVQLVQFSDEKLCPETSTVLAQTPGVTKILETNDAQQYWQSVVKPLITNPCSSIQRQIKSRAKILKTWKIDIDPTSTTESDTDPHCKFVDIFHKLGKVYDYHTASALQTYPGLSDAAQYMPATNGISPYPNRIESSMYLVIQSMQQDYTGNGQPPDNVAVATFDMNVQVSHVTVQAP